MNGFGRIINGVSLIANSGDIIKNNLMERIFIKDAKNKAESEIFVSGWIHSRRDHGKLIFIDLRDYSGLLQVVFTPNNKELYEKAQKLRSEWVVGVKGRVNERPKGMENSEIETGKIELQANELVIYSESKTPPFAIETDGREINEELRLKYKYLDLRRSRLVKNLSKRHELILFVRNWLSSQGFLEIETPNLTKSTPEGARDYVVPSRLQPGSFYALPQSPQQFKQLLMVAGLERYFQFARCFRDEDTRGDRQPEFTQMDLEMSFVEREDVMELNERLMIELVKKIFPDKKIQKIPFPRISYQEAMKKYKTDRPDLRNDPSTGLGASKEDPELLAFCWVVDFPFFERVASGNEAHPELAEGLNSGSTSSPQTSKDVWTFTHNPFSAPKPEHMEMLMEKKKIPEILTTQYDLVLNGMEIGGGSIRNHQSAALKKVFEVMGYAEDRIKENFGHMLEAFDFGAPVHGGIAWGLDRLVSIFQNEPNIREVIAFPKTGDGRDLMMGAPSTIDDKQLKELKLKIGNSPDVNSSDVISESRQSRRLRDPGRKRREK
ncbi:MAG: Aspartyl-tRNA synthetase [Parcubacteria group bacterium GW2011_GWB1_45_10]|nr:MAG: Aspartyl-tRNA synthetase [Parcubacteria group bacterium GW2011_GWB1_45_10]